MRQQGGALGASTSARSSSTSKGHASFKDILKGKVGTQDKQSPNMTIIGPYIVEKMEKSLHLSIELLEVSGLFNTLQAKSIICRFNGF